MAEDTEERIMIVPLRKLLLSTPRTRKAHRANRVIKSHVAHHMKAKLDDIWLDTHINEAVWKRGIENPPARLRIKVVRFKDQDLVEVSIPEE
ncbi:MAG: 50S ribosomal protein L31e [Candidatus Thermoplasmatota archaeon]|jgi:large subunit ribosomal protein L31e|nr:50S ribosomal protein L31e [Candidatus Thermoplasmatota archaeon]